MTAADGDLSGEIKAILMEEIAGYDPEEEASDREGAMGTPLSAQWHREMLEGFKSKLQTPEKTFVRFEDGSTWECWRVTRPSEGHSVVYMPDQKQFSLCIETADGLADMNLRGDAIGCFGAI